MTTFKEKQQTPQQPPKTIFVTVGTTLFNPLIESVTDEKFLHHVTAVLGYRRLIIQYGKGNLPTMALSHEEEDVSENGGSFSGTYTTMSPTERTNDEKTYVLQWEAYRFLPSLKDHMSSADLILSHAGAGTIMEGLSLQSDRPDMKLVVVINQELMNNHQLELANALKHRGYLHVIEDVFGLLNCNVLDEMETFMANRIYKGGNNEMFGRIVDDLMGFATVSPFENKEAGEANSSKSKHI